MYLYLTFFVGYITCTNHPFVAFVQPRTNYNAEVPITVNNCLNTFLETLAIHSSSPPLICQALLTFLKCNGDTHNSSAEELNEAIVIFDKELSKFQLNCELSAYLINIVCEKAVGRCLVSYFNTVLRQHCTHEPSWTCPYMLHFMRCISRTICSSDTIDEIIKLVEDLERDRKGYNCETHKTTRLQEDKTIFIKHFASMKIDPKQAALTATINVLLHDYPVTLL